MTPSTAAFEPRIELQVHGDFVEWLAAAGGALAVTTYNSGKLAFYSAPHGLLRTTILKLPRPMGLAYRAGRLAVAVREQILVGEIGLASAADTFIEACPAARFQPAIAYDTGRLDVHELAFDNRGIFFANTRFNCLARPSQRSGFRRVWRPPFVPVGSARDGCHLNGVGVQSGRVAMVTAFSQSADPGSWRTGDRFASGVVIDVRRNCVAVGGLCMPHSPRWDGARWWLCNSGDGALGTFDPGRGAFEQVIQLPGFARGLCFAAGRAVVGLSRIRRRHVLDAPPVRRHFPTMRSGVWLVDPGSGRTTGALEFVRGGREVFDVAYISQVVGSD